MSANKSSFLTMLLGLLINFANIEGFLHKGGFSDWKRRNPILLFKVLGKTGGVGCVPRICNRTSPDKR